MVKKGKQKGKQRALRRLFAGTRDWLAEVRQDYVDSNQSDGDWFYLIGIIRDYFFEVWSYLNYTFNPQKSHDHYTKFLYMLTADEYLSWKEW